MASQLVRGFKAQAERIATSVRRELKLRAVAQCDPLDLARHLEVPVCPLSELLAYGADQRSVQQLSADIAGFSAMTVFADKARLIVYNEDHAPGRRANSLSHECSHLILKHAPISAMFDQGRRMWDGRMEEEADWLAAAILVPREGALDWLRGGGDVSTGAEHFGVSRALFQWRVNQTGIPRQLGAMAVRA